MCEASGFFDHGTRRMETAENRDSSEPQSGTFIPGITGSNVKESALCISSTGQLGVLGSSEKYKTTIAPVGPSTRKLEQPRPVTFRLKTDPLGDVQYGLTAEEVV
jgi:hypothetical protein